MSLYRTAIYRWKVLFHVYINIYVYILFVSKRALLSLGNLRKRGHVREKKNNGNIRDQTFSNGTGWNSSRGGKMQKNNILRTKMWPLISRMTKSGFKVLWKYTFSQRINMKWNESTYYDFLMCFVKIAYFFQDRDSLFILHKIESNTCMIYLYGYR